VIAPGLTRPAALVHESETRREGAVKPWSLAKVTHEGGKFVHESCGTFFALDGAEKQFTLIQGLSWQGGDSIDDYC
jgi:hypothetical protein